MKITKATRDYCGHVLKDSAIVLNKLTELRTANKSYHPQADALSWDDEYSEDFSHEMKRVFIVLLQLRTRKILDSIDCVGLEVLGLSQFMATTWSFNCPARFASTLAQDYVDMRNLFQSQSDALISEALGRGTSDF
ncbi:hypothetical protein SH449x_000889 [Pirellulaceae bacterium SH449]